MLSLAELGAPAAGVERGAGQVDGLQVVLGIGVGLVDLAAQQAGKGGGPLLADVLLAGRLKIRRCVA